MVRYLARALPVDLRQHDLFRQPFEIPIVLLERHGQIVEQLRIGRLLSLRAKVIDGAYNALSEMSLPHAIHEYARHQRILR